MYDEEKRQLLYYDGEVWCPFEFNSHGIKLARYVCKLAEKHGGVFETIFGRQALELAREILGEQRDDLRENDGQVL